MATRIDADGTTTQVFPADGKKFTLKELQEIVGGYIEILRDASGQIMYLNEDGKRLNLPVNHVATRRMRYQLQQFDQIVGNVILCTLKETGDDKPDTDDEAEADQ